MGSGRDKRRRRKRLQRHDDQQLERWAAKSDAQIFTEEGFHEWKQTHQHFVLGVMGFAGSWKHTGLQGAELAQWKAAISAALERVFLPFKDTYGARLVIASGATNQGVLALTYALCECHQILAMGITPDQTLHYDVGTMDYLLPVGRVYGDESEAFLLASDAFVLLGGGQQSQRESIRAHRMGKPLTIIQGFGGVADSFTSEELPNAIFLSSL